MTTNKPIIPNNSDQNPVKKRGRPKLEKPTINVHCRVSPDLYEKIETHAEDKGFFKAGIPNISKALMDLARKSLR